MLMIQISKTLKGETPVKFQKKLKGSPFFGWPLPPGSPPQS